MSDYIGAYIIKHVQIRDKRQNNKLLMIGKAYFTD